MKIRRIAKRALLIGLAFYVLAYIGLSRFGMHVVDERWGTGGEGFFYVPVRDITSNTVADIQSCFVVLFYPIWLDDHHCFGTPRYGISAPQILYTDPSLYPELQHPE